MLCCAACFCLASCSLDLTDQLFPVDIGNDTNAELVVDQCDRTCASLHDHADLRPGDVMAQNVSDANIPQWFLVSAPNGKRTGCLVAQFNHKGPKCSYRSFARASMPGGNATEARPPGVTLSLAERAPGSWMAIRLAPASFQTDRVGLGVRK